jgi:two-component sensor histidine kinase
MKKVFDPVRNPSLFSLLAVALLGATCIPLLLSVLLWRLEYSGNSNWALGLAQIQVSLDGATELLRIHRPAAAGEADPATLAALRLYLNGPVVKVRVGPAPVPDAEAALANLLPGAGLSLHASGIVDPAGVLRGERNPDGSWSLLDEALVREAGTAWDSLDEGYHRALANQRAPIRMIRDGSRAVLRVGSTGYIWAISAAVDPSSPCFEVFHPQLEGVDVSMSVNHRGERVGFEIASLRGALGTRPAGELVRYDYYWKNPEDPADRKKVVLMRHLPEWDLVLCAGLYEDEYFQPARAAESMFVILVAAIGAITLGVSFAFAVKLSSALNTLADYSRSTAAAAGAVHSLRRTGIRELDSLAASMSYMEGRIIEREHALKKELEQKTVLVEEVHHRVKNNLAVLASIINLQRDGSLGAEADQVLSLLQGRINSMAQVYQQLIGANEFVDLPFDDYLLSILAYYQSSRPGAIQETSRKTRLEPIRLKLEIALPLGLIANELISNAYRHGLPPGRAPSLAVSFSRDGEDFLLAVSDNGDGLPPDCRERMGLTLVRALCAQLRGSVEIRNSPDGGTVAEVRIPAAEGNSA